MPKLLLQALDLFFFVFHIALILFNLFGWLIKGLRRWNFLTLSLTAFSWFILGYFYGFGYCFLTDWHYSIRDKLGYITESNSYIHFLITHFLDIHISEVTVDFATALLFFTAIACSAIVNLRAIWK